MTVKMIKADEIPAIRKDTPASVALREAFSEVTKVLEKGLSPYEVVKAEFQKTDKVKPEYALNRFRAMVIEFTKKRRLPVEVLIRSDEHKQKALYIRAA